MKRIAGQFLTQLQGLLVAALIGWLVHLAWPVGGWIVFWLIAGGWLWIGWRYASIRDAEEINRRHE